ncbi:acyl-CoA dehydrogenase family protein [Frankia gtarii]|uniref:acyl-CoA dehydrogenase family protein n=1 Tax=Frankia gtarii TaxID=2950102 RepID=UPI0021C1AEF6|nr:acyl-CoA dehydrogenase family protein [Frankia gtarii]
MNFSAVELDEDTRAFWAETRAFFDEHVTEEVHAEERRTGSGFNEAFHRAFGARGWVLARWPVGQGGAGLDPVRARIMELELERSGAPVIISQTTPLPALAVQMFANEELKTTVLAGVGDGSISICLGYTEPDCGSDLAAVRTRAVQEGDEWIINGQKMFTTGAQVCQYSLCLTRTDPAAPKRRGLSVFLVPLDLPGIEIRPIHTVGGERTNIVHFDDVRVSDYYRLGGVNQGWAVLSAPLANEHGMGEQDDLAPNGGRTFLRDTRRLLAAVVTWLQTQVDESGRPRLEDPITRERLARVALDIEAGTAAHGPMARIHASGALARAASDLLELMGPAGLLPHGAEGAVAGAIPEYMFRFTPGTSIYGGTNEIHRNLVAEKFLGLPRSTPRD